MIYEMKGSLAYIRVLSFQLTGHVVWLSQEPVKGIIPNSRVPMCVPGLDYVTYIGAGPGDVQPFYGALKSYKLVCNMSNSPLQFEVEPLPEEFIDRIKLYRIKCYAIQSIQNMVGWGYEKNGLYMNPIIDPDLDFDVISSLYQKHHGLTKELADKLLQFKFDEHKSGIKNIKYTQIDAELAVTNAKSVLEVSGIYKNFLLSMGMSRASDEPIMRFM